MEDVDCIDDMMRRDRSGSFVQGGWTEEKKRFRVRTDDISEGDGARL